MPIMGMTAKSSSPLHTGLAGALFSATQQKVSGYLFGQPDRSFYATGSIWPTTRPIRFVWQRYVGTAITAAIALQPVELWNLRLRV